MSIEPKAWLPSDALARDRLEPIVNRVLSEWSEHWFARARASAAPAFQDDWPRANTEAGWRSCLPVASILCTPSAQGLIAGAMLGVNVPQGMLQPSDRDIVEQLATTSLDDLLRRVSRLATGTSGSEIDERSIDVEDCSWWDVSLGARKGVFKLAILASAMIEIAKRDLPRATTPALGRLADGLKNQRIEIAADLGRCRVSLAELQEMSVGDVLVLDSSSAEPLDLTINGSRLPLRASLEAGEDATVLVLAGP